MNAKGIVLNLGHMQVIKGCIQNILQKKVEQRERKIKAEMRKATEVLNKN